MWELLGVMSDAHNAHGDVEALQKLYKEKLGKALVSIIEECLFQFRSYVYLKDYKALIDRKGDLTSLSIQNE